jgi:hypothetical protein
LILVTCSCLNLGDRYRNGINEKHLTWPMKFLVSFEFKCVLLLLNINTVRVTRALYLITIFNVNNQGLSAGLLRQATYTTARLGTFKWVFENICYQTIIWFASFNFYCYQAFEFYHLFLLGFWPAKQLKPMMGSPYLYIRRLCVG